MKTASKALIIGGVFLLILGGMVLIGQVTGCRPCGWHEGSFASPFRMKGPHPRFMDKNFPERVLKHLDGHVEELNLTETQKERYEALKTRLKAQMDEGRARRTEWVSGLRTELNREKPDVQAMAAKVKEAARAFPQGMEKHVDFFVEFYGMLDDGQQRQVIQRFRDRMGRT